MALRDDFLKAYANLPLSIRKEAILVMDDEPMTWNAVYVEVFSNTERGAKLLEKLAELKII
ncbi:hypothetical protein HYV82_05645 [Candidatus Woesearchaeota archaeon]|nr:hypothetical protein [Candidatus Woesearchaeota archaeon]